MTVGPAIAQRILLLLTCALTSAIGYAQAPISQSGRLIARDILGRERARQIVTVTAYSMRPHLTSMSFYAPALPLTADICGRAVYRAIVSRSSVGRFQTPQVEEVVEIAQAPSCQLRPDQSFVSAGPRARLGTALALFRALESAAAAARAPGTLPFALRCDDRHGNRCEDQGRGALGRLEGRSVVRIEDNRLYIQSSHGAGWSVRFENFGQPGAIAYIARWRAPVV